MKTLIFSTLTFLSAAPALASNTCDKAIEHAAYTRYAVDNNTSVEASKSLVDLFENSRTQVGTDVVIQVELAEAYSTGAESGWFPGTKYEIRLANNCEVLSVEKLTEKP